MDKMLDRMQLPALPNLPKRTYRIGGLALLIVATLLISNWHTGWLDSQAIRATAYRGPPVTVMDNAHKLHNADEFWPHFTNVTRLPPMSMEEAKSGCTWSKDDDVNFTFGEKSGWFLDLSWVTKTKKDREIDPIRAKWQKKVMKGFVPYETVADRFHGRGIVLVSGDGRSLKRLKVIFKQLARLGCKLPVELHYFGHEMPNSVQDEVAALWPVMFFNDLKSPHNIKQSAYNTNVGIHYQLKTAAMVNSRFEEPLLLDSDNVPLVNPETLYETDLYKEYGSIFWPDIARTRMNNPIWPITNTKCRMNEYEQESGQVLINKKKFFYHLQLAAWFIDAPDNTGQFKNYMLGDKDCFRFAWHALKTKYGYPSKWLSSVGTLADGFYCGHTFAQYHPDGQVAFMHGGLLKTLRKPVVKWHLEESGGIYQAYKRSPYEEDHTQSTHVEIGWDNFDYMPNKPENLVPASCVHFSDVEPRPLEEIAPGFQETFREIGGYWMLNDESVCEYLGGLCVDTGG